MQTSTKTYCSPPNFQKYLLISQTAIQVEKFTKNDANQWFLSEYANAEDVMIFASFDFEISL